MLDRTLKRMIVLSVKLPNAVSDTSAQLRTGLVHRQQDTGDLQLWIEACLHLLHHFEDIGDALTRQVMCLNRNDTVVRRSKRVHCQQLVLESAVEVGVNLKDGYNGDLTSREAGSVGGQMVKKMIESYAKGL